MVLSSPLFADDEISVVNAFDDDSFAPLLLPLFSWLLSVIVVVVVMVEIEGISVVKIGGGANCNVVDCVGFGVGVDVRSDEFDAVNTVVVVIDDSGFAEESARMVFTGVASLWGVCLGMFAGVVIMCWFGSAVFVWWVGKVEVI